jgi:hypothetical protein
VLFAVSSPTGAMMRLPHSGSTLYCCSVERQEREAGLTRNDYFSLWQAQRYAEFTDDATAEHRSRRVGFSSAFLVTVSLPLRRFLRSF